MQSANSLVATREVINQGEAIIRQARRDAAKAQARAERAEEAMEAARIDRAAELEEAARWAEAEADHARAALNQLGEAEGDVSYRDRHIAELSSTIQAIEARAERAKEAARRAASLATEEEAKAREAEAAAEGRVTAAVEEFRMSARFSKELAEASADAYLQGFRDGKEKVVRVLDFPHALEIEPDQMSEGTSSDDEPAAADP